MTESEYRTIIGMDIHDAMLKSKAKAGKLIVKVATFMEDDNDSSECEYYAKVFNEVSKIMGVFALEISSNMHQ